MKAKRRVPALRGRAFRRRRAWFVASLTFERLPAAAVEIARTGIIDTVATMIAGAHDPAPQLLRQGLAPAPGPASLYFSGEGAAAPEAAWINGTAGHALDYDDVGCRGHISTVLLPAILAEAETLGAGGREMFSAYVAGYETWAELARRDPGHHHVKGWHPTGIFGAIGAGAACAASRPGRRRWRSRCRRRKPAASWPISAR